MFQHGKRIYQVASRQVISVQLERDVENPIDRAPDQKRNKKRADLFFQRLGVPAGLTSQIRFHGKQKAGNSEKHRNSEGRSKTFDAAAQESFDRRLNLPGDCRRIGMNEDYTGGGNKRDGGQLPA